MGVPQIITTRNNVWSSNSPFGYSKETKTLTQKDIYTPISTAALFMIAKTWKQLTCPLIDEWIFKNVVYTHIYTHNGILLSHKKETPAICNIDGPWEQYAKWNKSNRERQMPYDLTHGIKTKHPNPNS